MKYNKYINILFIFLSLKVYCSGSEITNNKTMITTYQEHVDCLKNAIQSAQEEIIIISPFLSYYRLNEVMDLLLEAKDRGVNITIVTDRNLDRDKNTGNLKDISQKARNILEEKEIFLLEVNRLHSKNILVDSKFFSCGSCNWLSFSSLMQYQNMESTMISFDSEVTSEMIGKFKDSLEIKKQDSV
tara:strand:+ start:554 stop:1111 length:558 start_codon:yes stop_codon:yes gene_type:complete